MSESKNERVAHGRHPVSIRYMTRERRSESHRRWYDCFGKLYGSFLKHKMCIYPVTQQSHLLVFLQRHENLSTKSQ